MIISSQNMSCVVELIFTILIPKIITNIVNNISDGNVLLPS
jgi:hypothetical protein